jgi:hypothetical protein
MKKSILLAILLVGAGLATSRAGVAFGINIDSSRGYVSGNYTVDGCAQPSGGYVYSQPSYRYGYSGTVSYPTDVCRDGQHKVLHRELKGEHRELHWYLRGQHEAVHRELRREAASGVPPRVRNEQHLEAHRDLEWEHRMGHREIRQDHRDGHYDLGW